MNSYEKAVAQCYSTWGKTYYKEYYSGKGAYPSVHVGIVREILKKAHVKNVIDAGCGPASMLRELKSIRANFYGFDLTLEMVEEGKRVFSELGLDPVRLWHGSVLRQKDFYCASGPSHYDAVISCGVMPHIIESDEMKFIKNIRGGLKEGGLAIVEARNELFSLFTMNRYSYSFFWDRLIGGDNLLKRASSSERRILEKEVESFRKQFRMDQPPVRKGKKSEPGYDEVVSRTHNPFELRKKFEKAGFSDVQVLFYHYHALPPIVGRAVPNIFLKESVALENAMDWRGHFMASAFFVVAKV
jgi:2-polyprenyl-3-methyl-5-hydroxy-6-metoxy-1,4-benzoquinol methylase